jgi:hypothetical protein
MEIGKRGARKVPSEMETPGRQLGYALSRM